LLPFRQKLLQLLLPFVVILLPQLINQLLQPLPVRLGLIQSLLEFGLRPGALLLKERGYLS
jgi:hypothetical protein